VLRARGADFRGTDRQTDTYFRCPRGRLKLREGNIERSLIHYARPDQPGPKPAEVCLYHPAPGPELKELLTQALGVQAVVAKRREIYFLDNVKFHIDHVEGLGDFVEIEAIDTTGRIGRRKLQAQCEEYMRLLGIREADLVACSYSDMLPKPG
jgi:adenylate cyclase class IV